MDKPTLPSVEKSECQSCIATAKSEQRGNTKTLSNNQLSISEDDIEKFKSFRRSKRNIRTYINNFTKQISPGVSTSIISKEEETYRFKEKNLQNVNIPSFEESKNASFLKNNDGSKTTVIDSLSRNNYDQSSSKPNALFGGFNNNIQNENKSSLVFDNHLAKNKYNINTMKLLTIEEIKYAVQNPKCDIRFSFYELFKKYNEHNENDVRSVINECIKHVLCQDITKIILYFLDGQLETDKTIMEYLVLDTYGIDTTEFENVAGFSFNDLIEWGIGNEYFTKLDSFKIMLKKKSNNFEKDIFCKENLNIDNKKNQEGGRESNIYTSTNDSSLINEIKGKMIMLYVFYMGPPEKIYPIHQFKNNVLHFCDESFEKNFCKKYFNSDCFEDVCKKYLDNIIEVKKENGTIFFAPNKKENELWEMFRSNVEKYAAITGKEVDIMSINQIPKETNIAKNLFGIWIPKDIKFSDLF
uniref:Serine/threonine protein kinase n=1 Tax=Strongyloides venezuelensis TaxID=75913 RepID=A0A0K0F796_STRVS